MMILLLLLWRHLQSVVSRKTVNHLGLVLLSILVVLVRLVVVVHILLIVAMHHVLMIIKIIISVLLLIRFLQVLTIALLRYRGMVLPTCATAT
jgi:hypothetical protein